MPTFDFGRLDGNLYCLDDPQGVKDFQIMVEDFINIAKVNPDVLNNNIDRIKEFCLFVSVDDAWSLAQLVVPEFRVSQDLLIENGSGPMHLILQSLKHKLPLPTPDSNSPPAHGKELWKAMLSEGMLYAPTLGRGVPTTIPEEPEPGEEALTTYPHTAEANSEDQLCSVSASHMSLTQPPKRVLRRKQSFWCD
ncbi:hypothetical protein H2204_003644 [Knufia peltigerae]|uniref:Uncharacterized protein n=1 Tax=Knufia peltigerae TaxID=1002370 RepID=A0AA39D1K8_9EURO|nr:hypothetical protein H2204_003644 [Knufia peltigerae]